MKRRQLLRTVDNQRGIALFQSNLPFAWVNAGCHGVQRGRE